MNENPPENFDPDHAMLDSTDSAETVAFDDFYSESNLSGDSAIEMTELERVKNLLAESEKRALMAAADLENYRKRANRNAQEQVKYASLPMMSGLLESADNLNRAIEAAVNDSNNAVLLVGVKMVADQILEILKSNGCQPIAAVGQTYDPHLHEAVQTQASADFPTNTIITEIRTGYMLHERVIRPAQVIISSGPVSN